MLPPARCGGFFVPRRLSENQQKQAARDFHGRFLRSEKVFEQNSAKISNAKKIALG